ncbi:Peptidyl-prolyl cis-trans isomerase CYP7 [Spathaspora sp. JA1]|nr:Peptidyl-prolyl cis-trans isomerase CYP7 [Spathaspora sp. JA1]
MKIKTVRPKAYLDISIGDEPIGRIVVELFTDLALNSSTNFLNLVKGIQLGDNYYTYQGNAFHRIIKNFVIQAGSFDDGNISTIYGDDAIDKPIPGENLDQPLDSPFLLCSANNGDANINGSQFFITTFPQPHLTGKHSVFGKVIHGKSVVREIERANTNSDNVPQQPVTITNCGEWNDTMEVPVFNACYDTIGGDIFEEYPDDDENIDKDSSESVYNAAVKIKESGTLLFKTGAKDKAYLKYRKCLRYVMEYIPDQDQEPNWFAQYSDLKKKLYLNLSLVCLQLKNYTKAIDYSSYLLDLDNIEQLDKSKALFRRGCCLIELKKYKSALNDLKIAQEILPSDVAINNTVTKCETLIEQEKNKERTKYSKFFS